MVNQDKIIKPRVTLPDYAVDSEDFVKPIGQERESDPRFFRIWYVGEETSSNTEKELKKISEQRVKAAQEDPNKRVVWGQNFGMSDIWGELKLAYEIEKAKQPPEIIIIKIDQAQSSEQDFSGLIENIRKQISDSLKSQGREFEESLLQPIMVAVVGEEIGWAEGNNKKISRKRLKEIFIEQGANVVVDNLNEPDLQQLIQLVAKLKSDLASLLPKQTDQEKKEFYAQIVKNGFMGERSEISADTEQELKILKEILEKYEVEKILDVGCGAGRITNQLAEDNKLKILGMDSNTELLERAQTNSKSRKNVEYIQGDLFDFSKNKNIDHGSQDAVVYTWNTILEAFGLGNLLKTLNSAWLALKKDGVLIFDVPTRENKNMQDGWYYIKAGKDLDYYAYIMTEKEIKFILKMAGFKEENIKISKWKIKGESENIKKITVVAQKN